MIVRITKRMDCAVEEIYILDDELSEKLDTLEKDEIEEFIRYNGEYQEENIIDVYSDDTTCIETETGNKTIYY